MMKKNLTYLFLFVIVAFVSSCSSTKKISKSTSVGEMSQKEYVDKIIENSNMFDALNAKSVFTLNLDNKTPLSVSGTMKIKKGEVVILSAAPLLGIEVARVEITPSAILVIDRMKKRYVKASYEELNRYLKNNLDYNSLESLFLNSIFLPGVDGLSSRSADKFTISKDSENVTLHVKGTRDLDYSFTTDSNTERVIESDIFVKGTSYALKWKYENFKPFSKGEFPYNMNVNLDGIKKKISLQIELTRISNDSDWSYSTEIPRKYEKVGLDEILKIFAK